MKCNIVMSKDIDKKYKDWAEKTINKLTNTLQDEKGRKFVLKKPINTIYILSRKEYENVNSILNSRIRYITPSFEAYVRLESATTIEDVEQIYAEQPAVKMELSPAFWTRGLYGEEVCENITLLPSEGYIFICPDLIREYAVKLSPRIHELQGRDIESHLFKVILLHEIGHHYSFGNLPEDQLTFLHKNKDLNLCEGLGNWFAFLFSRRKEERWILAESSLNQGLAYRYYYVLRFVDITSLLDALLNKANIFSGVQEFAKIAVPKVSLNGHMLSVATRVDGFMMDWSDKGGKILAGESIQLLGPMMSGCFITPKIEVLIGRFPKNTLIVTNEITKIEDYGKLPPNIIILPKDKVDISAIIRGHWNDKDVERLKAILADLGLTDKWCE